MTDAPNPDRVAPFSTHDRIRDVLDLNAKGGIAVWCMIGAMPPTYIIHPTTLAIQNRNPHAYVDTKVGQAMDVLRTKTMFMYPKGHDFKNMLLGLESASGELRCYIGLFRLGTRAVYMAFTHPVVWSGRPAQSSDNLLRDREPMHRAHAWTKDYWSIPTGSKACMRLVHAPGDRIESVAPEVSRACYDAYDLNRRPDGSLGVGFPITPSRSAECFHDWIDNVIEVDAGHGNVDSYIEGEVCTKCGLTRESQLSGLAWKTKQAAP